jgi:hypothetical protein
MRTGIMTTLLLLSSLLTGHDYQDAAAAADDGSQVAIVTPKNGQVIAGGDVDVQFKLVKGNQAYHAHVFLDGQYQTAFHSPLMGLKPGPHEIKVIAATADHRLLKAADAVRFEVR